MNEPLFVFKTNFCHFHQYLSEPEKRGSSLEPPATPALQNRFILGWGAIPEARADGDWQEGAGATCNRGRFITYAKIPA